MTITLNTEKQGIEIRFDNKPETTIIQQLKENGFRWSKPQKMWYAKQTDERMEFVRGLQGCSEKTETNIAETPVFDLWAATRTDNIEYYYAKTKIHDTKEIAKNIRTHLRKQFPMCKWSVTSDYHSVDVQLKASPFKENSDEVKAIIEYANTYMYAWNYDNSDLMTDYFEVNFYGHTEVYYKYEVTTPIQEVSNLFKEKQAEHKMLEELEFQKQCEREEIERQKREEEYKQRVKEEAEQVQEIEENAVVTEANYFVLNAKLLCNKSSVLEDEGFNQHTTCQIIKEVELTEHLYNNFTHLLLEDFSFLGNTGGSHTDDNRINSATDYAMMSPDERESVEWYCVNCVAIKCNREIKLVIDAQGYNYARYVYAIDGQSIIVNEYMGNKGITDEEFSEYTKQADVIAALSNKIISENNLTNKWDSECFDLYKSLMSETIKSNKYKFDVNVIRALTEENLKSAMYKLHQEFKKY